MRTRHSRRHRHDLHRVLAPVVVVVAIVATLAGCSADGSGPPPSSTPATASTPPTASTPATASTPPTVSTPATASTPPTASTPATGDGVPAVPAGLVALWPFTSPAQVRTWQAGYRSDGRQPWHLDVDRTATAFAHDHLGYIEIDRITGRAVTGADARIGVGWRNETGRDHTVGVLHLVRFGADRDAPWVVVGSEDTLLTLTVPRYGATAGSPLTVGGRITGVDESLHVLVLGPTSGTPLGEVTGLPAGGEDTPWTTTVRFAAPPGTPLTVAVSTGGHLMTVERFAITAVRAG